MKKLFNIGKNYWDEDLLFNFSMNEFSFVPTNKTINHAKYKSANNDELIFHHSVRYKCKIINNRKLSSVVIYINIVDRNKHKDADNFACGFMFLGTDYESNCPKVEIDLVDEENFGELFCRSYYESKLLNKEMILTIDFLPSGIENNIDTDNEPFNNKPISISEIFINCGY